MKLKKLLSKFNKYSVSILNKKWEVIHPTINVKFVPRMDEMIFINEQYYRVIGVVHNILDKQGIFIIVEELGENIN